MSDDPVNYAEHPKTIGELKIDRDPDARWSPRDMLISFLRDIDAGKIDPKSMVVIWDTEEAVNYGTAGKANVGDTIGLLEFTKQLIFEKRIRG